MSSKLVLYIMQRRLAKLELWIKLHRFGITSVGLSYIWRSSANKEELFNRLMRPQPIKYIYTKKLMQGMLHRANWQLSKFFIWACCINYLKLVIIQILSVINKGKKTRELEKTLYWSLKVIQILYWFFFLFLEGVGGGCVWVAMKLHGRSLIFYYRKISFFTQKLYINT